MLKVEPRRVCVLGKPPLRGRWDVDRAWGAAPRWVAGHVACVPAGEPGWLCAPRRAMPEGGSPRAPPPPRLLRAG